LSVVLPRHCRRDLRRRGLPEVQLRTLNHLAALEQAGHRFVISGLTHTECLVSVLGPGNEQRLADFFRFFHGPNLRTIGLTSAMLTRAAAIRSGSVGPVRPSGQARRYGLADALHLAAAIESGCDVFLTNDNQLMTFSDIKVEELL
jgi:hypothetical protein